MHGSVLWVGVCLWCSIVVLLLVGLLALCAHKVTR